ncbi:hypothetical protein DICSQDRAFT_160688 [Dichomitus squalens LYAD-421 SS1]|uniref:uncharacterized protein n=1 Tax=Dichomitus squalens (strain LYAD-421) TaxID=732165 RepID=UPI0004412A00|nr:uncharacterized protein DICSQDRAFT_160688 [Dichomitus squalens LYAD-421 SS1]EJF62845.1 hypothetical protein DICSQDRAFT_160688 [Dichomitus squalens LYAD-421 SS1]
MSTAGVLPNPASVSSVVLERGTPPLTGFTQPPCIKLPPEILSKVFLIHLARLRDEHLHNLLDPWRDGPTSRYYKWILVTHVCRYWRDVAHNYAKLWTFVALQPRTVPGVLHPDVLQRAGRLNLSIVYHQTRSPTREGKAWRTPAVAQIRHLLPRIRDLYLVLDDTDCTAGELCGALKRPAENLRSLHIAFGSEAPCQIVAQNREIPPVLFDYQLPMLHTLTISNGDFAWNNSLFRPSIRHLEIIHRKRLEPAAVGIRMFLEMLTTLPLLETLITDSVPEYSPVDIIVDLPNLRLLDIRGAMRKTGALLSQLRFPSSTTISVGILSYETGEIRSSELEPLTHALRAVLLDEPLHTINYAVVAPGSSTPVPETCRAWAGEPAAVEGLNPDSPPRLVLTGDGVHTLPPVLRSLDLSHLRNVRISGLAPSTTPWSTWLEGVPKGVHLRLEERASSAGIVALDDVLGGGHQRRYPARNPPISNGVASAPQALEFKWPEELSKKPRDASRMRLSSLLNPLSGDPKPASYEWTLPPVQIEGDVHRAARLEVPVGGRCHTCGVAAEPSSSKSLPFPPGDTREIHEFF